MTQNAPTLDVTKWRGLNNQTQPDILGLDWFTAADNLDLDSAGRLANRPGRVAQASLTNGAGIYATHNKERLYLVADGTLYDARLPSAPVALRSGFIGRPSWAEKNQFVYLGNANQIWRVSQTNVTDLAIGRPSLTASMQSGSLTPGLYGFVICFLVGELEGPPADPVYVDVVDGEAVALTMPTGAKRIYVAPANAQEFYAWQDTSALSAIYNGVRPEELGERLETEGLDDMPACDTLTFYQQRLHGSTYDQASDTSHIWRAMTYWPHLCDLDEDRLSIKGRIVALRSSEEGLAIATERNLYELDESGLHLRADYGCASGYPMALSDSAYPDPQRETPKLYAWTQRGLVQFFPFLELHAGNFIPASADFASLVLMRRSGEIRAIASAAPADAPDNQT